MTTPHQNVVICNLVIDDTTMIEPGMIVCSKKNAGGKLTFHTAPSEDIYQVVGVSLNFRARLDKDKVKLKPIAVAVRGIIDVDTTHCTNKICGEIIEHKGIPFGTVIANICSVSGVGSTLDQNKHRIKLEPQLGPIKQNSAVPVKSSDKGLVSGGAPAATSSSSSATTPVKTGTESSFATDSSFKDAAKALKKKKKRSMKAKEV